MLPKGKTATGRQRVKRHRSSGALLGSGQRTLDSMLGSVTAHGALHTPVSKSKDRGDHLKKDECERKPALHPGHKEPFSKSSGHVKTNDKITKASAKPQREREKPTTIKKERVKPIIVRGSPAKQKKVTIDLSQSPITKYLSPTKRHPTLLDQPDAKHKRSPHTTNGFISITDASVKHLHVHSLSTPPPIIDLTVSASPIDLCSTPSSSLSNHTSTPKSNGLASLWERFNISTSPSVENSSTGAAMLDLNESEDYIPLEVPMNTTVGSLCGVAGGVTTPVQLHACARRILRMPLEVDGSAVAEMDEPVRNLDTLRRELKLEFEQWNSSPGDDLRELAVQRMVHMQSAPSPRPVSVVPLRGCHAKEYLESSLSFKVSLALEEVLQLLSPYRMPSAEVLVIICEKVILAEESTSPQRETGYSFLMQVLNQFPPGRSEVVRQVYVDTFKQLGQPPLCRSLFGGRMRALLAMMTNPTSGKLLVLHWMNNLLLSDLLTCTHSTSMVPMINGLSAGLRLVLKAAACVVGTSNEGSTMAGSLSEECLVTIQLYATHLLLRQEGIHSLTEQFSMELLEAGINHSLPSLKSVYPLQLRNAIMSRLKQV